MKLYESLKLGIILLVCFELGNWFVIHYPAFKTQRKVREVEPISETESMNREEEIRLGNH